MQLFQQRHGQAQRRTGTRDPVPARARVRDARRQFLIAPPARKRQGLGQRPDNQRVQPGQCDPSLPFAHWRRGLTADGVDSDARNGRAAPFRNARRVGAIAQPERKKQGAQQPSQTVQTQAAGSTQPHAGPEGAVMGLPFLYRTRWLPSGGSHSGCGDEATPPNSGSPASWADSSQSEEPCAAGCRGPAAPCPRLFWICSGRPSCPCRFPDGG